MHARIPSQFIALIAVLLLTHVGGAVRVAADEPRVVTVDSAEALHAIFENPVASIHVRLKAGEYELDPAPYTDPTCGNCQPDAIGTPSPTTVGLHIRGSHIRLSSPENGEAVLRTNAGYGLLIEDGDHIHLERLTITGGIRSTDSNATDGAVVVRRANVTLHECTIRDNIGDEAVVRKTVSGVMGIVGRENATLTVQQCRILRNSWDGIALYRDAKATIENTIVDGMERSVGATIGGGRGVGIGVTWNAHAIVRATLIRRYWKGLGIFVDARVAAEHVIVEDIVTWGIAVWGAGDGKPIAHLRNNIVFNSGACGVSIAFRTEHDTPGALIGHAIVRSGQNEAYDAAARYCRQCPIARASVPDEFHLENNLLFDNRRVDCEHAADDVTEEAFREAVAPLVEALMKRPALKNSSFLREFGAREADEPAPNPDDASDHTSR